MCLEAVAASASRVTLRGTTVAASSVGLSRFPLMRVRTPNDDPFSGQWVGVMLKPDRPVLTTKFVMALHDASIRNPTSWRRVSAIGARTGIKGAELDQVVAAAVAAGLVENRADNSSLVRLTDKGWLFARR